MFIRLVDGIVYHCHANKIRTNGFSHCETKMVNLVKTILQTCFIHLPLNRGKSRKPFNYANGSIKCSQSAKNRNSQSSRKSSLYCFYKSKFASQCHHNPQKQTPKIPLSKSKKSSSLWLSFISPIRHFNTLFYPSISNTIFF